jgi:NAD(P)-dependent dehydrogenase (short-subunit alcohol dehydrogenase family)
MTEGSNDMSPEFGATTGSGGMSERVAIVVGAGGDLGRATAQKLAAAGFTVVGVDRNEEALKGLPDGIRYEAGDPTDPAVARSLVDQIAAEVGPPEVLVNTIGTYHPGEALDATPEDLRLMIDVNAGTALWLTQAVVPYMRERGSGAIVHVSARPGLEPTAGMATYGVSKAALVHLIRLLDLELRPLGIRVNTVAPQLLDTAKTRPYLPPDLLAHAVSPEAIADVIAYLVSDAATSVSGAVVPAYGV